MANQEGNGPRDDEFEAPPAPRDEIEPSDEDEEFEEDVDFAATPDELQLSGGDDEDGDTGARESVVQLLTEIEQALFSRPAASAEAYLAPDAASGVDNIYGVGIGSAEVDFESVSGEGPGDPVLNVYVGERMDMDGCKAAIVDSLGVRTLASDSIPVNVIPTGPIDALAHRHKQRPSPCGISVGHYRITAGTQGALARGRTGRRRNRLLMLSNNHVLADVNAGKPGDSIIQPGRYDGGVNPRDRVAILEKFVPVRFNNQPNYVDCATGWCWPDRVRREFLYRSQNQWKLFRVSSRPTGCRVGTVVGKSGRTTQLTVGRITDCDATIRVNFGRGRIALYRDQITIRGVRGQFSAGGDSGSLIWSWDNRRNPVGLLFAGGGGYTFANKIPRVLSALGIQLYT